MNIRYGWIVLNWINKILSFENYKEIEDDSNNGDKQNTQWPSNNFADDPLSRGKISVAPNYFVGLRCLLNLNTTLKLPKVLSNFFMI